MIDHAKNAFEFNNDKDHVAWHNQALWHVRKKRDQARDQVEDWEELREKASLIKSHTLTNLHNYLLEFEKKAETNGWKIHWATDAKSHNRTVFDILNDHKIKTVLKSKSMLTEECGLNEYLEKKGIKIIDTDLGERIVQLLKKPPSHIVLPAIHLKKKQISELFHRKYQSDQSNEDPDYLAGIARQELRNYFNRSRAAISGVNFALADSGSIVVCTNEGNADMGIHHADVYIACMGIEKVIPGKPDLGIFLKLLARSATGQSITAYTSHLIKPPPGKEYHLIVVDNGRTNILADKRYREVLKCIRCGACINTCPVYRRSGGYSYGYTIPGPVGSVLAPLQEIKTYHSLPYASSLCGSCTDVCPVKINLHEMLYNLRSDAVDHHCISFSKKLMLKLLDRILYYYPVYRMAGFLTRKMLNLGPRFLLYNKLNSWGKSRELPDVPATTFKKWYKEYILNG